MQLAAKFFVRLGFGANRGSPELATIVLLAPVWDAVEVTAHANAAASETQGVGRAYRINQQGNHGAQRSHARTNFGDGAPSLADS